ncbi:hypothetical protein GQ43DRAFT_467573 [Delitschia confertaspora ATCC 74209]|uniref:Uncharacterized protein n=1 Tax=Delitschia confertaspora ATCC 74209 TaxID=1513339 RepID=A0A9P4JX94_9PLEO|nr:hypothetical protein GQ43DRAFT_467573 [Delitschia confertaspora ATCC 74209]
MVAEQDRDARNTPQEPDFAQVFQELARGERTATALENHLDALEKKIEELLAKADDEERKLTQDTKEQPTGQPSTSLDQNTDAK